MGPLLKDLLSLGQHLCSPFMFVLHCTCYLLSVGILGQVDSLSYTHILYLHCSNKYRLSNHLNSSVFKNNDIQEKHIKSSFWLIVH